MTSARPKVCAVVVTYNRKELLLDCLNALVQQTFPLSEIVVVDNHSSDGTAEAVRRQFGGLTSPKIDIVTLSSNTGGAGGFHTGFERALTTGCDWIWAMDDDGKPNPDALEKLIIADAGQFRGALILKSDTLQRGTGELAFTADVLFGDEQRTVTTCAEARAAARNGLLPGFAFPFNGVLVSKQLVRRIGLPDARFFMWGDEWDYWYRAKKAGVEPTTVVNAIFWHPYTRSNTGTVNFFGRTYTVPDPPDEFRTFLVIRNYAYIASRYRGPVSWLRHTMKFVLFHQRKRSTFTVGRVIALSLSGLFANFSGHERFLTRQ